MDFLTYQNFKCKNRFLSLLDVWIGHPTVHLTLFIPYMDFDDQFLNSSRSEFDDDTSLSAKYVNRMILMHKIFFLIKLSIGDSINIRNSIV